MTKITDIKTIKALIESGVTSCPENVDANVFNVLLQVENQARVQDVPFEVVAQAEPDATTAVTVAAPAVEAGSSLMPKNGRTFDLDDFEESTSTGDPWISISGGTASIGKEMFTFPAEGLKCKWEGDSVKIYKGVRMNDSAGKYHYYKTLDGVRAVSGENWNQIVEAAQRLGNFVYTIVEARLTIEEDLFFNKKLVAEKGTKIMFGNAPTGAKYVRAFSDAVKKTGKTICNSDIDVVLKIENPISKSTGKPYQVLSVEQR